MKKYYRAVGFGILWGIVQNFVFFYKGEEVSLSRVIWQLNFPGMSFSVLQLVDMVLGMFPFFVFQILYGTFLYRRFCTASVFYFSRCTNRVRWFLKETLGLYLVSVVYFAVIVVTRVGLQLCNSSVVVDRMSVVLTVYSVAASSLWGYLTAVIMNLVAIKKGSSTGFIAVAGGQIALIMILSLWDRNGFFSMEDTVHLARNSFLLKCNPAAHLVLDWHSTFLDPENELLNRLNIAFDLSETIAVFLVLTGAVMAVGCFIIKRHELLTNNVETGGI